MKTNKKNIDEHIKFAVLAVDVVLFTIRDDELLVKIVSVNRPPFFPEGSKGFPGGLIKPNETAEEASFRILEEKTGILTKKIYIEQLYTFSQIERDPRGRVVSVSYIAFVPWNKLSGLEKKNSPATWWAQIFEAKEMAYDHDYMLLMALKRLQSKVRYSTLISKLLPSKFTLGQMERAYTSILNETIDKRNFRKKIAKIDILKELPGKKMGEPFRPAKLYSFASNEIQEIEIL